MNPNPEVQHRWHKHELDDLCDTVLAGEVFERVVAERVVRALGALLEVLAQHRVDHAGRCHACKPVGRRWQHWWRRRAPCLIDDVLSHHLAARRGRGHRLAR